MVAMIDYLLDVPANRERLTPEQLRAAELSQRSLGSLQLEAILAMEENGLSPDPGAEIPEPKPVYRPWHVNRH